MHDICIEDGVRLCGALIPSSLCQSSSHMAAEAAHSQINFHVAFRLVLAVTLPRRCRLNPLLGVRSTSELRELMRFTVFQIFMVHFLLIHS